MGVFARITVLTAALSAIAAALGAWIVIRVIAGTQSGNLLATPATAAKLPDIALEAPPLDAHLESLRDRALFYASRSFYIAPPPPAAPAAPPRPAYLLAGTMIIPDKYTVALLKQSSGERTLRVKAGDELEGWRIDHIDGTRVTLSYGDERFVIGREARGPSAHITRVQLTRGGSTAGASTPAAATSSTVKSLGRGGTPVREAVLPSAQGPVEARLYRRPSQ